MTLMRTLIVGSGLAASALAAATPAQADRGYYRRGGDTTGAAIAGGIVGLAVGAAIASSGRHDHYYDGPRYPRYRAYYVYRDHPRYYGGWDRGRWEHRRWEREQWERRRWQERHWDRDYPRHRGW